MQLVEQHVIAKSDPRYALIDEAAFKSKNLYNAANYEIRQSYIHEGKYLHYPEMDQRMQTHEAYRALPAKVSQQVLKQLATAWESFFKARDAYFADPAKFQARPKLPAYKHKTQGRNLLIYTIQAISRGKKGLKRGIIKPSMLAIEVKTKQKRLDQVRIVPRHGFYVVEAVYEKEVQPAPLNPAFYAGIDLGITNLVALTSNKPSFQAALVNGRPLKSVNQFYNKRKAALQSQLGHPGTTHRLERLTNTRNRRIDHDLHTISRQIIDLLVKEQIGVLCIGKNEGWKQEANLGKRTTQHFVQIPHARLIHMLTYKAQLVGMQVEITEESYTSKASLLDLDPLLVYKVGEDARYTFSGRRVKRGLYRVSDGRQINADCNGSGNIIRKVAPTAFGYRGVEDGKAVLAALVVHPVRIVVPRTKLKTTTSADLVRIR